jgi:CRISPR-associated protein Cmr4
MVNGSGVKGALRAWLRSMPNRRFPLDMDAVFGPDEAENASDHAGAIAVGDAQIVLFPVRALKGVFAYVTSAHVLARVARAAADAPGVPKAPSEMPAFVSSNGALINGKLVLEEFDFTAQEDESAKAWAKWLADNALPQGDAYAYWREHLTRSLVILPENDFRDFTANSTQIDTHVKLDRNTKTVMQGALWTSESLPPDSLLVSVIGVRDARKPGADLTEDTIASALGAVLSGSDAHPFQLGGDETTGQGVIALRWR